MVCNVSLALHGHQQAGDMSPACGTPSDRAAVYALHPAPLFFCLPADPNHNFDDSARQRGRQEKSLVSAKGTYSGRIAWTGEGFLALLTQRPHLMSCPFNAANVCNAQLSTNIGAIPFR